MAAHSHAVHCCKDGTSLRSLADRSMHVFTVLTHLNTGAVRCCDSMMHQSSCSGKPDAQYLIIPRGDAPQCHGR
eukprot:3819262-Amphidinium_carterae.1